jgi:hypothetical protein
MTDLGEAIARARARRQGHDPDMVTIHGGRPQWMFYLNDIDADLAAIESVGWQCVPKEPTVEMRAAVHVAAYDLAQQHWRAYLDAAPKPGGKQ